MKIRYQARWKEMLDGFVGDNRFTVEFTMGRPHVYFPTEETWKKTAPDWAKDLWAEAQEQAAEWSKEQKTPFDIDAGAWVEFEEAAQCRSADPRPADPGL